MRAAVVGLLCFAVHVLAMPTDTLPCTSSGIYSVLGQQGIFGCNGYGNSVTIVWNVNDTSARSLTFLSMNTEACCDKVTITYGTQSFGPFSGTANPGEFIFGGGNIIVTFKTDASGTAPGFTIQLAPAPPVDQLEGGQPLYKQIRTGGFTYFQFNQIGLGSRASFGMSVSQYDGLQMPGLFISVNRLPSLESYTWYNGSNAVGQGAAASINVNTPPSGTYWIGVFLYGNSATVTMTGGWTFGYPSLSSGVKVSGSTAGITYQLFTPRLTRKLNYQLSRQVPGGYPIAYIGAGYLPSAQQYDYVMDTTTRSYVSLDINNPNPSVNYHAFPGTYLLTIVASSGQEEAHFNVSALEASSGEKGESVKVLDTAGFILMATWA